MSGPVEVIYLTGTGKASQLLLTTALAYVPSIIRPYLLPPVVRSYKVILGRVLTWWERLQQQSYIEDVIHRMAALEREGVNSEIVSEMFGEGKIVESLQLMSESPRDSLQTSSHL